MIPADLLRDLQEGKLSQRCPTCGTAEAAGGYSTCHETPTGSADWYRAAWSPAQVQSHAGTLTGRRKAATDPIATPGAVAGRPVAHQPIPAVA